MNVLVRSQNGQMILNLTSNLAFFGTQLLINFFLTPYIVENIGLEANGFIALGNNFINLASLATIAIGSMSSRFITISLKKNNFNEANTYYTSSMVGNILISSLILLLAFFVTYFLEYLIDLPSYLAMDVKKLFFLLFFNFVFSNAFSTLYVATFATNRLYLASFTDMLGQIVRIAILIFLFTFYSANVIFVALAVLGASAVVNFMSYYYKKQLTPDLSLNPIHFRWRALREMVFSGSWNTVANVGVNLLSGFDLFIANILISPSAMGVLALSKTIPVVLEQLSFKITSIFSPTLTFEYAIGNPDSLVAELKKAMKITMAFVTVPVAIMIMYGYDFYLLWLPSENAILLQQLSFISFGGYIFTSGLQVINTIFTVYNKLELFSLSILISGIINIVLVVFLLNISQLGVYAVPSVSLIVNLIRYFLVVLPLASKYLGVKFNTFYPEVLASVMTISIQCLTALFIRYLIPSDSWLSLGLSVIILGISGIFINFYLLIDKRTRIVILNQILNMFNKIGKI